MRQFISISWKRNWDLEIKLPCYLPNLCSLRCYLCIISYVSHAGFGMWLPATRGIQHRLHSHSLAPALSQGQNCLEMCSELKNRQLNLCKFLGSYQEDLYKCLLSWPVNLSVFFFFFPSMTIFLSTKLLKIHLFNWFSADPLNPCHEDFISIHQPILNIG